MIKEELLQQYQTELQRESVSDLRIGLGYTVVQLDSGKTGLAATLRYDLPRGCSLLSDAGGYIGINAYKAAQLLTKPNPLEAGIGLATINAIANQGIKSNAPAPLESLAINSSDKVGMVGYFEPMIEPIREVSSELYIFERESSSDDSIYPDWAINSLLPTCDISIISSTTLINGTIDHILNLASGKIALLGPSTPFVPDLRKHGVSYLFGSIVISPKEVMEIVSQGGGTRNFGDSIKKINLGI